AAPDHRCELLYDLARFDTTRQIGRDRNHDLHLAVALIGEDDNAALDLGFEGISQRPQRVFVEISDFSPRDGNSGDRYRLFLRCLTAAAHRHLRLELADIAI